MSRVTAVLGPTNTGKTHYAIERMLAHRSGVIGLPLRLLAREVYDRIVAARGPSVAALITGEERIVGPRAQYWVATTEAMPIDIGADFLAVDEIQLCADPERGHVFTDRLLHARGQHETLFLGSDTMRPAIAALIPGVTFMHRERFSTLSWAGPKKLSRMPARSAIVGFSVDDVYATAEVMRRLKGGCAVVMGALSPRTRNAQVALYQNGDVDHLVATDAIGMGLNLDIRHVAFEATAKFDGRRMRPLFPHELGQIAGRAGRHTEPGTFGVTGEAAPLDAGVIAAIENHQFQPITRLMWRNPRLDFSGMERLIASAEAAPDSEWLTRGREADDLRALKALSGLPEIRDRVQGPRDVRQLWEVCRIPDFRAISPAEHVALLARIFAFLQEGGVPSDWIARSVERIDRSTGNIDTLSRRLAHIRTWTYVAQRRDWVQDEEHWRDETRAVEDRLSDALHAALTQRFVDRRTSVLLRRLKQKESLVAEVNNKGEVSVEGEFAGRLEGFRFRTDPSAHGDEARMLTRAAHEALRPEFHLRADRFYNAPDAELDLTEQGGLMWGEAAIGKLVKGDDPLKPRIEAFVDEEAGAEIVEKVTRRLQHFIDRRIATHFEPLLKMRDDETLTGLARGMAFRLVEALGILPRAGIAEEVRALDQDARGSLRKHGVRFGQFTIFQPALLKPAPTRLRLVLWGLANDRDEFPESPPPGLVTIPNQSGVAREDYTLAGYHPAGERAIRIDMLERLADLVRQQDSRAGFEATPDMLSITGMTLEQFAGLLQGLGYNAEKGERPKPPKAPAEAPETAGESGAVDAKADGAVSSDAKDPTPETQTGQASAAEGQEAGADSQSEAGASAAPEAVAPTESAPAAQPQEPEAQQPDATEAADTVTTEESRVDAASEGQSAETPAGDAVTAASADPAEDKPDEAGQAEAAPAAAETGTEIETFYIFTWAPRARAGQRRTAEAGAKGGPRRGPRRAAQSASGKGGNANAAEGTEQADGDKRGPGKGPRGKGRGGKNRGQDKAADAGGRSSGPRAPRHEKPLDPDSPFAVLAGLKLGK